MKIRASKNLKCDRVPWEFGEGYETFEPRICFLESFSRSDDKITLYFKNGSQVVIKGINVEGGNEIDLIENKLDKFLEKSYEEILNADF